MATDSNLLYGSDASSSAISWESGGTGTNQLPAPGHQLQPAGQPPPAPGHQLPPPAGTEPIRCRAASLDSVKRSAAPRFKIGQATQYDGRRARHLGTTTGGTTAASLPPLPTSVNKQFRLLRLRKDATRELGILITLKRSPDGSGQGYVIGHVEPGGVADRFVSVPISSASFYHFLI